MKPKSPYVIVKCENCGGVFSRLLSQAHAKHTFCSLQCRYDWTKRKWREGKTQMAQRKTINKNEIFDERGKWRKGHLQPKEWRKRNPVHDMNLLESVLSMGTNLFPITTGEAQRLYNLAHNPPISRRQLLNIMQLFEQEGKITRKIINGGKHGGRTYHIIWRKTNV